MRAAVDAATAVAAEHVRRAADARISLAALDAHAEAVRAEINGAFDALVRLAELRREALLADAAAQGDAELQALDAIEVTDAARWRIITATADIAEELSTVGTTAALSELEATATARLQAVSIGVPTFPVPFPVDMRLTVDRAHDAVIAQAGTLTRVGTQAPRGPGLA